MHPCSFGALPAATAVARGRPGVQEVERNLPRIGGRESARKPGGRPPKLFLFLYFPTVSPLFLASKCFLSSGSHFPPLSELLVSPKTIPLPPNQFSWVLSPVCAPSSPGYSVRTTWPEAMVNHDEERIVCANACGRRSHPPQKVYAAALFSSNLSFFSLNEGGRKWQIFSHPVCWGFVQGERENESMRRPGGRMENAGGCGVLVR